MSDTVRTAAARAARWLLVTALLTAAGLSGGAGGPLTGAYASGVPYEHVWQARTFFSGETGSTRSAVIESSAVLALVEDRFSGTIVYADLLGIEDATGAVFSQEARLELDLRGVVLEGGAAAGGPFSGRATLVVRPAANLAEAVDTAVMGPPGEETVYALRGHWGANVEDDGLLAGEVIFESARLLSGEGIARDAAWFNRASVANPDGLGDAQVFTATAEGLRGPPGGGGGGDEDDPDTGGAGSPRVSPADGSVAPSIIDYIARGLRGVPAAGTPFVPAEELAAVRRLVDARPLGATALPPDSVAIDLDLAGGYLDAKNRAAGLLGDEGPSAPGADRLAALAHDLRERAPRIVVPDADTPALRYAARIRLALEGAEGSGRVIGGAEMLLDEVAAVGAGADREQVLLLRSWASAVEAVSAPEGFGSVLAASRATASEVADAPIPAEGPLADAVLAAADSYLAPPAALVVADLPRAEGADHRPEPGVADPSLPGRVLALHGSNTDPPSLDWVSASGQRRIAPVLWPAHRRADGSVFWLAGEGGDVALTDASVRGWAFARERAALVDSARSGRVLHYLRAE